MAEVVGWFFMWFFYEPCGFEVVFLRHKDSAEIPIFSHFSAIFMHFAEFVFLI